MTTLAAGWPPGALNTPRTGGPVPRWLDDILGSSAAGAAAGAALLWLKGLRREKAETGRTHAETARTLAEADLTDAQGVAVVVGLLRTQVLEQADELKALRVVTHEQSARLDILQHALWQHRAWIGRATVQMRDAGLTPEPAPDVPANLTNGETT